MSAPRVVSLLPAATETICGLGGFEQLIAISHECDFPPDVESLPRITKTRTNIHGSSKEIDRSIQKRIADSLSIYEIDGVVLRELSPDVIVTQDLCEVCAVSTSDLCQALETIVDHPINVVTLHPTTLDDIWENINQIGVAIHRDSKPLLRELKSRLEEIREKRSQKKTRVVAIEWLDPVMLGGLWMSELVEIAGGISLGPKRGEKSVPLQDNDLEKLEADIVVVKPCGFSLSQTRKEISRIRSLLPSHWLAAREHQVYLADGNAFFNRSGPRIVDSAEILAAILDPSIFSRLAMLHAAAFEKMTF